ncbi:MAG TPA: ABC transporter ATP-binding protein [Gemmataceae bacterium]|jgi:ATP-binding cassette subfamily B protein|nr:ABC transporter ATP-binding protein [Gemmataceae bacterium]
MESSAFSRVRSLFRYTRAAQWTAILTGIATALLYALLVLLLAMFVDLLVNRGRIPNFAQLSVRDQESALREWSALSDDDKARALRHVGFNDLEGAPPTKFEGLSDETRARWRLFQAIAGAEGLDFPPVPGVYTSDNLREWAAKRKLLGDPYYTANLEHDIRWRAYVWHYLDRHVGSEAADHWQPAIDAKSDLTMPAIGDENHKAYGMLSLVVRQRNTPWARPTSTFASIAGWSWRSADPNRGYMTGLLVMGLILVFLRGVCMVVMNEAAAASALEVVTRLRRSIYHHTARQGAMTINNGAVDEAGNLFTRQVEYVHEALLYSLTHSFRYAVFFPLMLLIALLSHFWLALAALMFATLVWAIAGQMTSSFRHRSRVATRVATNRLELLLESLRHMRLVKSYLMELFNQSRVERQLSDYAQAQMRRSRGDAFAKPVLTAFAIMAGITLLYLGGWVVLNEGLSVAGLVVLAVAFLSLYFPVRARLAGRRIMRHGREAAAAIFEFLDRKGDVATFPDADFLPGIAKGIEFADVTVREPGTGHTLLNKVSFKIRAGQKIGIVGSDVDEQVALVSLIPRFLDPNEGEVKIDGRSVKWVTQDSLRSQIGLVLQNNLVFNDTVANNIGCGDPSYTLPQIIEAAKLAHAHQFIQRMPYGYETPIGELGRSLSPGEQFRIALARAVLRDPSLYVIEEPTEYFDDDTKDLVDDTLNRVLPGKTVIYLPHRVSTLRHCDKIFLLHDGKIVAAGEHRELIADNELYRHLYYLEFNPFADAVAT